jgi:phage shock protein C
MPKKKSHFHFPKRPLRKSKKDKILTGVIGGIAEFLGVDSTLLRIIWLIGVAFTAFVPGIITYAIAALIIPKNKLKA